MTERPQYDVLSVKAAEMTIIKMAIGCGVSDDPYRHVVEYWYAGTRLAREDPYEQRIASQPNERQP